MELTFQSSSSFNTHVQNRVADDLILGTNECYSCRRSRRNYPFIPVLLSVLGQRYALDFPSLTLITHKYCVAVASTNSYSFIDVYDCTGCSGKK